MTCIHEALGRVAEVRVVISPLVSHANHVLQEEAPVIRVRLANCRLEVERGGVLHRELFFCTPPALLDDSLNHLKQWHASRLGTTRLVSLELCYDRRVKVVQIVVAMAAGLLPRPEFFEPCLHKRLEQRTSGVLITAIIFAGIVSLGLQGNYTYFGTIDVGPRFPDLLAVAVVLIGAISGVAGGIFCWILLNTHRWMPSSVLALRSDRPVAFGAACGLIIAVIGMASGGHTFGSGYAEARAMLEGRAQLGAAYPVLKMASMVGSYLPGAPGGLFAPSLAIGAGIGNALHLLFGQMQLPMLIALGMVGYLAAVTQSPITAFVIVIEMINGHALVISLMATALIASQVSKLFAPALYEALSERYGRPVVTSDVVPPTPTAESPRVRPPGQY